MASSIAKATHGSWSAMAHSSPVTETILVTIVSNLNPKPEKAGTLRMAAASKAYNQIIKGSPEWLALEQEYLAQLSQPGSKKTIRGYFISKHMKGTMCRPLN